MNFVSFLPTSDSVTRFWYLRVASPVLLSDENILWIALRNDASPIWTVFYWLTCH